MKEMVTDKMKSLKVLGVAAGNGVVLHTFKEQLIGNIEPRSIFYTPGNIQWKLNFGDIPFWKEVPEELIGASIDVIIGHPDCGHSSVLSYSRAKHLSDPRENKSLNLYLTCIALFKPKIFLLENLPKILQTITHLEFTRMFPNYEFEFINGPVTLFGNSQKTRKRLVVIGIRKDTKLHLDDFKITRRNRLTFTTQEIIGDIMGSKENIKFGHVREDLDEVITLFGGFKMSLRSIQIGWMTKLANKSRWEVFGRKFTRAPGVYRNLPNSLPNTVRKGNREFNPLGLMMTPRERARIQGIPDDFKIWMVKDRLKFCINKGRVTVTKCFPYEISEWFYQRIENWYKKHPNTDF